MTFEISRTLLKDWRVLVVDDEEESLFIVQTLLERCGATVITASNGQKGYELAKNHRPKFIISDLSMPTMSGWEMLRRIKDTPSLSETPGIALTAHAMTGDRERAMEVGFHNYLTKPLRPETFVNELLVLLIDIPAISSQLRQME